MSKKPKDNGKSGKDKNNGRFVKGNKCGAVPGKHPNTRKSQILRQALLDAVTKKDINEIVKGLIETAKKGNVQAAREVLDRCMGKPEQPITGLDGGPVPITIVDYANIKDADTS